MYNLQDISVIIPTYNRVKDLNVTLNSIKPFLSQIKEILIIDQSSDNKTKELIRVLKNKKLKYFYSNISSLTRARNFGVSKVSKGSKIICFFDDDVTLGKNYFYNILKVLNKNKSPTNKLSQ